MENQIIIYLLKSSISLLFFYVLYALCLRKDTFFTLKRFYFLGTILFSALFPLLKIEITNSGTEITAPYMWLNDIMIDAGATNEVANSTFSITAILLFAGGIISLLLAGKFLFQISSLMKLKSKNEVEKVGKYSIIELNEDTGSSFSFFNWIFLNTKDSHKGMQEVVTHEEEHVRQLHSIDVMISEILCIIFWWNPAVWLIRREMKINLEYLADRGVLNKGYNSKTYQYILLQASSKDIGIPLINNFNVSQLKQRIMMMNKKRTAKSISAVYILIIPIAIALLIGNAVQASPNFSISNQMTLDYNVNLDNDPTDGTSMPQYPGGEEAMMAYIKSTLKYPDDAIKDSIQGRVIVQFIVDEDGSVSNLKVMRGLSESCDKEALAAISSMPKWIPAKKNNVNIKSTFVLPIVFRLNGTVKKITSNQSDISNVLFIIDEKILTYAEAAETLEGVENIESMNILHTEQARKVYGNKVDGKKGVIIIKMKK